jgi:hypothetical protein
MSTPSHEPQQPLTAAQLEAWVHSASRKHWQLYLQGIEPLSNPRRDEAFMAISNLLREAIEKVRVVSAQLREERQAARFQSAEILAESARLLAQHTPMPESQLLQMFKGDQKPYAPSE